MCRNGFWSPVINKVGCDKVGSGNDLCPPPRPNFSKKKGCDEVKKKPKDAKSELVEKIQEAVTASKYVYVLEVENERNDLLKLCRAALRPGTVFCGKNKVPGGMDILFRIGICICSTSASNLQQYCWHLLSAPGKIERSDTRCERWAGRFIHRVAGARRRKLNLVARNLKGL